MESTNVFPKRLKEALYSAEMKPTDLASKSGISKATISNYMTGKYEPRQENLVFIRKQPMVENGQIAAVRIGDEFTLKRFYWDRLRSVVQLNAENPNYPPIIKTGAEIDEIAVIGLAVGFQHSLIPGKKNSPVGRGDSDRARGAMMSAYHGGIMWT